MLLVLGFLVVKGEQGAVMIAVGIALGSLAGLELSIREHFNGYRSHTTLLAAVCGFLAMATTYFAAGKGDLSRALMLPVAGVVAALVLAGLFYLGPSELPPAGRVLIGGGVFGLCAWALAASFRRSAGVAFKIR